MQVDEATNHVNTVSLMQDLVTCCDAAANAGEEVKSRLESYKASSAAPLPELTSETDAERRLAANKPTLQRLHSRVV